jgi:hypothetical protein
MIMAAAACCLSVAAAAKTTIMLPVGPGQPGNGPWTVEAWPDNGCADCSINQADLAAVQALVNDLLNADQQSATHAKLPVYVVRSGLDDGQTSVAKLKAVLAGCRLGSLGMLSPNKTTHLVAFGLRIDCEKAKHSHFMSVVTNDDHVPAAIYWMPDGPIVAADVH